MRPGKLPGVNDTAWVVFAGTVTFWVTVIGVPFPGGVIVAVTAPVCEVAAKFVTYALWPQSPWLMHAHSLAWYGVLVGVAAWVYRRVLAGRGSAWIPGLAALLYERSGSWSAGFYGSAVLALIAAFMAFGLRAAAAGQKAANLDAVPAK